MKKLYFWAVTMFFVATLVELFSYLSLTFVLAPKGAAYLPQPLGRDRFENYMSIRHPVLGWPTKTVLENDTGLNPDRTPSPRVSEKSCISLYGDSFTFGPTDWNFRWSEVVSAQLKCAVRNFGVGGYGSDQSYLRFSIQKHRDPSKIVVLNHLSENILRNLNQYRSLLYPGPANNFKPRFYIAPDGSLKLAELAKFASYENYLRTVTYPAKYLRHESFSPGGSNRGIQPRFPYTVGLASVLLRDMHLRAKISRVPWHAEFYREGHPDKGLEVTTAILRMFHEEAKEMGKTPIVSIIPVCADYYYFDENGVFPYEPLIRALRRIGIEILDFGKEIREIIPDTDPESLFINCSDHPNKIGYRIMGDAFARYIRKHFAVE